MVKRWEEGKMKSGEVEKRFTRRLAETETGRKRVVRIFPRLFAVVLSYE
jgi:hypothetical protein